MRSWSCQKEACLLFREDRRQTSPGITSRLPVIGSPREASTDATDFGPGAPDINDFSMAAKTERLLALDTQPGATKS
jgi:hypothetical protein